MIHTPDLTITRGIQDSPLPLRPRLHEEGHYLRRVACAAYGDAEVGRPLGDGVDGGRTGGTVQGIRENNARLPEENPGRYFGIFSVMTTVYGFQGPAKVELFFWVRI
ncbi:hypothetical protein [Aminivibrio sp.]|uniref:hypothetical protein n=1 Tax=Aminivibrio sp. TaxID=1872489 RepID=UPI001A521352|nr:hypothetical protein [Aminivibrio sp.]MBL3538299.1 hypothetical protein [Aminivibrio sp.]